MTLSNRFPTVWAWKSTDMDIKPLNSLSSISVSSTKAPAKAGAFLLLQAFFPHKMINPPVFTHAADVPSAWSVSFYPCLGHSFFANPHRPMLHSFYNFTELPLVLLTFPHPQYIVDNSRNSHHIWIYSRFSTLVAMKG